MRAYGACQVHDAGHTVGAAKGSVPSDRVKATRYVAGAAVDASDAVRLLAMLGLDASEGREETAA